MYLLPTALTLAVVWSLAAGNLELRPAGWLDKLVKYHREKLLNDVRKEAPMNIKASLQPRPEGYVDSPLWNLTSVIHLMTLIRHSEGANDVRKALRRMMGPRPSRRYMSFPKTYKHFPSLAKDAPNYFYYNVFSEERYFEEEEEPPSRLDRNAVLFISNPVESRLPSAQISVRLLRSILEERAKAARILPSTKRATISWKTHSTTTHSDDKATNDTSDGADNSTSSHGGESYATNDAGVSTDSSST